MAKRESEVRNELRQAIKEQKEHEISTHLRILRETLSARRKDGSYRDPDDIDRQVRELERRMRRQRPKCLSGG